MAEAVERQIQLNERRESAYKRSNKPLMEKKRRARINNCLTQLKALVLQAMRKDTNQYSKLEKADILEMTVKHLRTIQRQQISSAISQDPTVANKYRAGFNECANEVLRYLGSTQVVGDDIRTRLLNHLSNVMESGMHTQPVQKQEYQTCTQQLNVQIPYTSSVQQVIPSGCLLMPAGVQASPLFVQSQVVQNHGHIPTSIPQQQLTTQVCGSFKIVQNGQTNGPVAVYLGQSSPQNQLSQPVNISRQQPRTVKSVSTPPRTKASLKAFDKSAFTKISHSPNSCDSMDSLSTRSLSPMSCPLDGLAMNCTRTPSPLKEEKVWRPW
ncbi:hypothetical protein ACJMK2_007400 [Sinanodonta woodiana]|uniref:Uncharacterized protein n=1 Tax=Sinanodonta woodiana TaxID=1069815 RepID=A0ABD3VIF9_SINWO